MKIDVIRVVLRALQQTVVVRILIDQEFLAGLPELKAVVRYGVGYDNVDIEAATRHGVKVANVQGYANHSVSDHAIALMYGCARALKQGQQVQIIHSRMPPKKAIQLLLLLV